MTAFVPLPPNRPGPNVLRRFARWLHTRFIAEHIEAVQPIAPSVLAPAVWKFRDGLSNAEIGAILDKTPAQVAKLILEARRELEAVRSAKVRR